MRRLAILLAGAALLAGCAAPAVPEAASAVQAVSSEAGTGHAGSRTEQLAVLDGLVDFGADTAGCSLKTARAAAVLVEYLSASEFEDGTADTWRQCCAHRGSHNKKDSRYAIFACLLFFRQRKSVVPKIKRRSVL